MNIDNGAATTLVLFTPGSPSEKVNIWDFEITVAGATVVRFVSTGPGGTGGSGKVLASYGFTAGGGIVSPPGKHYKGQTQPGECLTLTSSAGVQINGRFTGILEIAGNVI